MYVHEGPSLPFPLLPPPYVQRAMEREKREGPAASLTCAQFAPATVPPPRPFHDPRRVKSFPFRQLESRNMGPLLLSSPLPSSPPRTSFKMSFFFSSPFLFFLYNRPRRSEWRWRDNAIIECKDQGRNTPGINRGQNKKRGNKRDQKPKNRKIEKCRPLQTVARNTWRRLSRHPRHEHSG